MRAIHRVIISIAAVVVAALCLQRGRADVSANPTSPDNVAKAHQLVDAAIKMTDSNQAVKLLWQATDIDPGSQEAYTYLGLYYNSKSDWTDLVRVYQKLIQNQPNQPVAYLNVGEAYMSFSPPRTQDALVYFKKAYELDPKS
ncbi:MAG TPA: hypothetical protein VEJ86_10270, partial [Candidatus Binataceae bacterium]|nr:hypothetical protein [Candidatus Binataceae bacterium]